MDEMVILIDSFPSTQTQRRPELVSRNYEDKFTSGPPVTTSNHYEFYSIGPSPCTTHWTNQGHGSGPSPGETEKHLFAVPDLLVGQDLLKFAVKPSSNQIADRVISAARAGGVNVVPLTRAVIFDRLNSALQAQARAKGISLGEAQADFNAHRALNGVRTIAFDNKDKHSIGGFVPSTMNGQASSQVKACQEDFLDRVVDEREESEFTEFESDTDS